MNDINLNNSPLKEEALESERNKNNKIYTQVYENS